MGRMDGKVALITGAARGQGRAHAVRLAQEGADIIAVDSCAQLPSVPYPLATKDDLDETARLVESVGRRVVTAVADVRDPSALREAIDDGVARLGRLDSVIANAGIVTFALGHDMSDELWQDMIDVNLTGVFHTCRAGVPHLMAAGGGSIVLTSSMMGLKAGKNVAHYAASKHGVMGYMKGLARDLAPHKIRVNCVNPGSVGSPMLLNQYVYDSFCPDVSDPGPSDLGEVLGPWQELDIPWVEPEDVTAAVLFLCSDEARYITGIALPVDGGTMLQ